MAKRLMAASETEMVRKTRQALNEMHEKRMALQMRAEEILGRNNRSFGVKSLREKGDAVK